MEDLLQRVNKNTTGIFRRNPELIVVLDTTISTIIGDDIIHISEFIVAKIKGKILGNSGHPEITDDLFRTIPLGLLNPLEILKDTRDDRKYIFIVSHPLREVVIEVFRKESGKTEINTLHIIGHRELKRLEHKFPVLYSSGETPVSRIRASP